MGDVAGHARRQVQWSWLVEYLRGSLWFVPAVMVTAAIALAIVLGEVHVADGSPLSAVSFPGGADGARAILQVVAGSVITVTGVVFSLTVVTLQLASTQFSPRLLRTFLRDLGNQVVLGTFLGTFAYALVALRSIQSGPTPSEDVVPSLTVTAGYLLALASVVALVYFIDDIARSIRIDSLMRDVQKSAMPVIDAVHPHPAGAGRDRPAVPEPPATAAAVGAYRSGFVQAVAPDELLAAAVADGVVVRVVPAVGDPVVAGAPLAWVWSPSSPVDPSPDMHEAVRRAVRIGFERTMQEDVGYALRQLVDVAVKALSPGVNDPTTAIHAINHLASIMAVLAQRDLGPIVERDDGGATRVVVPTNDLADHVASTAGQIRRYGSAEPTVMVALLGMLREVGRSRGATGREALRDEGRRLVAAAERDTVEPHDLVVVRAAAAAMEEVLDGSARG